jgi:hypothetical protein
VLAQRLRASLRQSEVEAEAVVDHHVGGRERRAQIADEAGRNSSTFAGSGGDS